MALWPSVNGSNDPGGDDLPQLLGSEPDEEESARNAVDDLVECVDALDTAADRIVADNGMDLCPGVRPEEGPQRVRRCDGAVRLGPYDRIAQYPVEFGPGGGDGRSRRGDALEPYAEVADTVGSFAVEPFQFAAAQPQRGDLGGAFTRFGAVEVDIVG